MAAKKKKAKKKTQRAAKNKPARAPAKRPARAPAKKPARAPAKKPRAAAARAPRLSPAQQAASRQARIDALARVFTALGARDAARWAARHVDDSSDELGRFMLLRALWLRLVEPGRLLAAAPADPLAGPAVERLMQTNSLADLDAVVRFAQRTAVVDACRVLDDPGGEDDGIHWSVYRVDAAGTPLWPLAQLLADVEETEP